MMIDSTALFPRYPGLWIWRGRCAREIGDLDDAELAWRRAADLAPADADVMNNLGVLMRARGRLAEAAAAYRNALTHAPDNKLCHSNYGNVLDLMGDTTTAEIHLRRALALDADFIDGHYNLGAHLVRPCRASWCARSTRA